MQCGDFMADIAERAAKDAWILKVLGLDTNAGASGGDLKAAQAGWAKSRGAVVGVLKELETAIRAMKDPLGDPAIVLVKSISANLTVVPETKQSINELRRYLETDSVIDDAELENGFGIDIKIRAPLTSALDALDRAIAA